MTFIVEDFKGRNYKVHCIEDCGSLKGGLWCMVYRKIGTGYYEDDYFTDFCIHPEDCDCTDNDRVGSYIQSIFYNEEDFHNEIFAEESILKDKAKKILEEYHSLDLENVTILTALENLSRVAEAMADIITDFVYDE